MAVTKPGTPGIVRYKLSEEEIRNPQLVIDRFFDYAGLENLREYLWDWFKLTISGTFNTQLIDKHRRYDMIIFYEHIERIIEAAHIIYLQQQKNKPK